MNDKENGKRINLSLTIPNRLSFNRGTAAILAVTLVGGTVLGARCFASDQASVPSSIYPTRTASRTDQPLPVIQGIKEIGKEDEDTKTAELFLAALFGDNARRNADGTYSNGESAIPLINILHSSVLANWNAPNYKDYVDQTVIEWSYYKDSPMKKIGYGGDPGLSGVIDVVFEFITPVAAKVNGKDVLRRTVVVRLAFDPQKGKNAPLLDLTGQYDYK